MTEKQKRTFLMLILAVLKLARPETEADIQDNAQSVFLGTDRQN